MEITAQFIPGLKLGIEYSDLDEESQEVLETDATIVISVDLAFLRILIWS